MKKQKIIPEETYFNPEQDTEIQNKLNVNDYLVDEFNEIKDVLAFEWQDDLSSESSQTPSAKRAEVERKNKKLGMWPTTTKNRFAGQSPTQIQMLENIRATGKRSNGYKGYPIGIGGICQDVGKLFSRYWH